MHEDQCIRPLKATVFYVDPGGRLGKDSPNDNLERRFGRPPLLRAIGIEEKAIDSYQLLLQRMRVTCSDMGLIIFQISSTFSP